MNVRNSSTWGGNYNIRPQARSFDGGPLPPSLVYTDIIHMIKYTRPSPSIFAYCKRSKTGLWEDLGMSLPKSTASLNKQTCDLNHAHSLTSMQYIQHSQWHSEPKPSSLPQRVRAVFSRPVYATRARILEFLSIDAEPACQCTETIFSVQCAV